MSAGVDREMELLRSLKVLSLGKDATLDDVKAAYRKLCKVWHPDRFGDDAELRADAEAKMREVNAAYEYVCPELEKRAEAQRKDWQQAAVAAQAAAETAEAAKRDAVKSANAWKTEADRLKSELASVNSSKASLRLGKGLVVCAIAAILAGGLVGGSIASSNQDAKVKAAADFARVKARQEGVSEGWQTGWDSGVASGKRQAAPVGSFIRYEPEAPLTACSARTWYFVSIVANPNAAEQPYAPFYLNAVSEKQTSVGSLPNGVGWLYWGADKPNR